MTHLTEEERQGLADGSLEPTAADAHLRACAECSADVDRIRRLMKHIDDSRETSPREVDDLWPGIQAKIEARKVVAMPGREAGGAGVRARGREWMLAAGALLAAGLIGVWFVRKEAAAPLDSPVVQLSDSGVSLVAVMDSTNAYEEEAQALLNRLELQRATMRPELARIIERDLRTIDVAIAELQGAIRNDPNNPALRRLLASSYRQKVDLLKRVSNAG